MDDLQILHTDAAPAAIGPYSQAVKVGNLLFTSGQIPLTPAGQMVTGDAQVQARQVFANLQAILEAAGTMPSRVVKATVFVADLADFDVINKVYAEFFGDHRPARTTVQVAKLPRDAKVEIEVVALL
jgi:2-iminobutanoate/2-iminopropanoate deaminase